jgi:hypothetical protein
VPAPNSFDFAVVRIVPRVERGEFVNAGVIVFCLVLHFLEARVHVDDNRLRSLWPELDIDVVRRHLEAFPKICAGEPDAGPIAQLSVRERFHWLVAPRSTVIQISPVHSGLCDMPQSALNDLFRQLVLTVPARS